MNNRHTCTSASTATAGKRALTTAKDGSARRCPEGNHPTHSRRKTGGIDDDCAVAVTAAGSSGMAAAGAGTAERRSPINALSNTPIVLHSLSV
jgi:hypothetical protein